MAESNSPSAALVGCTGLVGSQIVSALLSLSSHPTIHAIARRDLGTTSANLRLIVESDSSKWPQTLTTITPIPNIFLSALGTTRAIAGSFEAQRAIDYDLNLSLARMAKESGIKVYVLISSDGVSKSSPFGYLKMKAELEEAVEALRFPYTVIVKPGLLIGRREDIRPAEAVLRGIAKGLGAISKTWLTDWWAQDVEIIGRAAAVAGMNCVEGKRDEGVWVVGQSEIIKLGRTNWKEEEHS